MRSFKRFIYILLCVALFSTGCAAPAKAPVSEAPAPAATVAALPSPAPTASPEPLPTPVPVPAESEYYRDARMAAYAEHIVNNGLALQEGEEVLISAPVCAYGLVELVAEACYARGACAVNVSYADTARSYSAMRHLANGSYDELIFDSALISWLSGEGSSVVYLNILSPRFDLTLPSAEERQKYNDAGHDFLMRVHDFSKSKFPPDKKWCVAACANANWARKVYPDMSDAEAVSALWEDIFSFAYLDKDSPSDKAAAAHSLELDERAKTLTQMGIESLHFVGGETDVTVKLHQPHVFQGPSAINAAGTSSLPNIPCEECFTMPERSGVNGTVAASRPLVLSNGTEIENLRMKFVDGYLEEWSADSGNEELSALLEAENARYLGEVSMVSSDSPIFKSGQVYYTTLFDENAACHMAFGNAYVEYNLPAEADPDEEVNQSDIHIDFMFGTDDMEVTATLLDGSERTLMRDGVWAF